MEHADTSQAIVRRLIFFVQLARRPELLAEHVASVVGEETEHTREELLVAVDWGLAQAELSSLIKQPHSDWVLRRYLEAVVKALS